MSQVIEFENESRRTAISVQSRIDQNIFHIILYDNNIVEPGAFACCEPTAEGNGNIVFKTFPFSFWDIAIIKRRFHVMRQISPGGLETFEPAEQLFGASKALHSSRASMLEYFLYSMFAHIRRRLYFEERICLSSSLKTAMLSSFAQRHTEKLSPWSLILGNRNVRL